MREVQPKLGPQALGNDTARLGLAQLVGKPVHAFRLDMGAKRGDQVGQGLLMRIAEGEIGQYRVIGHTVPVALKEVDDPAQVIAGCDGMIGNEFHDAAPRSGIA